MHSPENACSLSHRMHVTSGMPLSPVTGPKLCPQLPLPCIKERSDFAAFSWSRNLTRNVHTIRGVPKNMHILILSEHASLPGQSDSE